METKVWLLVRVDSEGYLATMSVHRSREGAEKACEDAIGRDSGDNQFVIDETDLKD